MPTYREIYKRSIKILEDAETECANSELLIIFWYVFGIDRSKLMLCGSDVPGDFEYNRFCEILRKRCSGEPLQYAIGKCSFMDMDFNVGEGVLIPREDTSVLVNASIDSVKDIKKPKIIDLCSGSGCVALALERYIGRPCDIYAVEVSDEAFGYLSSNHKKYDSDVKLINDDIFLCYKNFEENFFDLIVSNPPYIKSDDIKNLQKEVRLEPRLALDGGKSGLDFYEKICEYWTPKLKVGGALSFEIGVNQYEDVQKIMKRFGINNVKGFLDINNIYRAIVGKKFG